MTANKLLNTFKENFNSHHHIKDADIEAAFDHMFEQALVDKEPNPTFYQELKQFYLMQNSLRRGFNEEV